MASRVRLQLEWRLGSVAIDWDSIAKKKHFDQVDTYMDRFKSTIKTLNDELKEIRKKEQEMRQITGFAFYCFRDSTLFQRAPTLGWQCSVSRQ